MKKVVKITKKWDKVAEDIFMEAWRYIKNNPEKMGEVASISISWSIEWGYETEISDTAIEQLRSWTINKIRSLKRAKENGWKPVETINHQRAALVIMQNTIDAVNWARYANVIEDLY